MVSSKYTVLEDDWDTILVLNIWESSDDASEQRNGASTGRQIRVKVSPKHLMIASPVFKAMLNSKFKEGKGLADGFAEVSLPDDNPEMLVILLNIIHGFSRRVPRILDLDDLLEAAILVDKYDLHEAVEVFSEMWIRHLEGSLPTTYCDDVICWMCISSVFRHSPILKAMTKLAWKLAIGPICNEGDLPIPAEVITKLDEAREETLREIFEALENDFSQYYIHNIQCSTYCDAIALGVMGHELNAMNLLDDDLKRPYVGFSVKGVLDQISSSRFLKLECYRYSFDIGEERKRCANSLDRTAMTKLIDVLRDDFGGLSFDLPEPDDHHVIVIQ
ncbi:hypothetical protein AJ80_07632 [Polytolypa hystricis UAMH7299]|uniref:BTB domain-containing protein n=1 Tax=Polytolypa hystricis (strain UAMH7299) TaxID=1447883 RepID=A0A2B7XLL9_POLH7|nr:hypothetical protein AJ80_07632 [Polytolypa hystricis UAMH7299]